MNAVVKRFAAIGRTGKRVVWLGIGSPLRADDAVGLFIVEKLSRLLKATAGREDRFYLGESAPENYSGEIRQFNPTHVIMFDAAQLGLEPGAVRIIEHEEIGGISFSTHVLPLKILANYLVCACDCEVVIVGIQPKNLEFAEAMTPELRAAGERFVKECTQAFEDQ
jgi:hydrogenase 3 maturation protease